MLAGCFCFDNCLGLMQGAILSPVMFSVFLNDFESRFIANAAVEYHFVEFSLFLLLYDLVLFSESMEGLENVLDNVHAYTNKLHLIFNRDETRNIIAIFRNGTK